MLGYQQLLKEVEQFAMHGIETGVVGNSELGNAIPYIFVGNKDGNCMIVQGAMHAREHITALLVLCQAKHLVACGKKLSGGIYFVPMVNPDGVMLCQEGLSIVKDKTLKNRLLTINGGSSDFSLWKANINGVDLNVNFDAHWGEGVQNVFYKSDANYVGKCPESEAESRALADFTRKLQPKVTLSYHCKGEIIYWKFFQGAFRTVRDRRYAEALAKYTGYTTVDGDGSVGGYKDWCIQSLKIPSYTIEVGSDNYEHPYPYSQMDDILQKNLDLPRLLLNTVVKDDMRLKQSGLKHLMED